MVLAALGSVSVPSRVVESVIAVSVLVSAGHAVRPVVRRGGQVSGDPLDGLTDTLLGHPLLVPAAPALAAAVALFHRRRPFARAVIDLVEDRRLLVAAPTTTGRRDGGRPRNDPWEAP